MQLQVILLPELHDVDNKIFNTEYSKITAFLGISGIDYLNLANIFAGYDNPINLWVSYDDAHPNAKAHNKIAEASLDFIAKKEVTRND
jgi:lysophospholipase L1-like esterase